MKKNYFLLFLLGFLFLLTDVYAQSIRYVKQGGTGDGSTWSNASGDLQEMINVSSDNDQVWVAAGTYKPNRRPDNIEAIAPANDRFNSFLLKTNVSVYGGFSGTEDEILDRDIAANETILSGNIGDENTNEDNTFHVVTIVNYMGPKTVFDGFIVEDGYTEAVSGTANTIRVNEQNVPSTRSPGIIMYFVDHMELRNLIIRNNTNASPGQNAGALYMFSGAGGNLRNIQFINNKTLFGTADGGGLGGAMYTYGTSNIPAVINFYNVQFINNEASYRGGGVFMGQYSNLKFYDCSFRGNKATLSSGGAFYLGSSTSNADFYNTDFIDNESETNGGAIQAPNSGRLNITGGTFRNNKTIGNYSGGAVYGSASGLILNIKGATFDSNKTTQASGGAIYFLTGTYAVENCDFINNESASSAGALYFNGSTTATTKVINCTFTGNKSVSNGGAVYSVGSNIDFISCRFIDNVATASGGAISFNTAGNRLTVINSLFFNNETKTTGSAGGGGAIYFYTGTQGNIVNTTMVGNRATSSNRLGGGIYLAGTSQASLYNTVSFGNRGNTTPATSPNHELYGASGSIFILKNTLTEFYGTNGIDGNIVGQNPQFLSTTWGDVNFLEVAAGSPVIDKADINDVPTGITDILKNLEFDALGRSRVQNGKMDIGAVEHLGAKSEPTVFYIDENLGVGQKLGDNNIVNTVPTAISNVPNHSLQGNIKWRIISGNETGAFAINETSGEISVANSTLLNYEVTQQFILTVRIEDDFSIVLGGPNYQQVTVVVNVNNLEEVPEKPIVENVVHGDVVTTYRPRLRGLAEPNSIITIYVDGKLYINPKTGFAETVTADETGAWSFRFPEELEPGYREFSVTSKPRISASETAQSEAARVNLKLYGGGTAGLKPTNILTPNGDGKNDVWTIENLSVMYPGDLQNIGEQGTPRHHEIIVYDKVGKIVFRWSSKERGRSYDADNKNGEAWNGTYNGNPLPAGTYYYNINIGAGLDRIKGTITIIRGR